MSVPATQETRTDDTGGRAGPVQWLRSQLRPPSGRAASVDERWRRRILWIGLLLLCFVPPLLSQSGRYVSDTKLPLWTATGRYLLNSLRVWQSSPYLGNEQHDGILFPMGAIVALLKATGLPVWIVERLWHGLLLLVAAGGMVLLVDTLVGRKVTLAQPVAAIAYAFNPYTLGYGLHGSAVFVPYAVLPVLLVVWIHGLRDPSGWFWAAVVALVFFAMGGGNGAPQVYALIPLLAYLVWAVLVDRSITGGRALGFAAKAGLLAILVNLYWLVGLTTQGVANDIAFSEQPQVINVTSSFAESLRLLGFWGFYGLDRFGPWYPSMQRFLTSPLLVLGTFALPVAAVAGAWRSRWKMRALFVLLAVAGVVVMTGIYPVDHSTPFGRSLLAAYRSVPGFSGLRTTYKFGSTLALALSLLAGVGIAEGWRWMRGRGPWRRLAPLVVAVLMVGLAANAYPLWSGNLYPSFRSTGAIPTYWTDAVATLERNVGDGRVFFAPGGLFAYYRWGDPVGGIAEANPQLSSVRRPALPIMERYGSNLLAAVEQPYQLGARIPGATAAMLRRMGVHLVVLQNDLNFARSNTARPSQMQVLLTEPGLSRESAFGTAGLNVPGSGAFSPTDRRLAAAERRLPPVQVLRVADPVPVTHAEGGPPLVVSGDAFGIPSAVGLGLVGRDQPILYSGNLTPDQVASLASDQPTFVVTDSNRRRAWNFAGVRLNYSSTLTASDGGSSVGYDLFDGRPDTQTVTRFQGAAGITASSYGSPFADQPWFRPSQAFDANPTTAWIVNDFAPVGQWLEVTFDHPIDIGQLTIDPYVGRQGTRQLSSVSLEFSDGSVVTRPVAPAVTTMEFAERTTSSLRIRIADIRRGVFAGPVGIRDVTIPGVSIHEALALPTDLFDAASKTLTGRSLMSVAPLAYVFQRAASDGTVPDEERGIDRIFRVPSQRAFTLGGTVRLDPRAADQELDRLLIGKLDVIASSSSRAGNNPAARASAALDGNAASAWTAAGIKGQWLQVDFPQHRVGQVTLQTAIDTHHSPITLLQVQLSDGTSLSRAVPSNGRLTVRFAPRDLTSVRVRIVSGGIPASLGGGPRPPAGIAEIAIPGVSFPSPRNRFQPLPCYRGDGVELDGQPVAVRLGGSPQRLLRGLPLAIRTCDGEPLELDVGEHRLTISGVVEPSTVELGSGTPSLGNTTAPTPVPQVPALAVHATVSGYRIQVSRATAPFYLVLGQNVSPSWAAAIGGRSLGPPLVLDGYSAGWRIDRTGSFTVDVVYDAQRRQDLAYAASGLALPIVVLLAAFGWRRRR